MTKEILDTNETFEDYIRNARDEFVKFIDAFEWRIDLRKNCEDLLIAYDQMRDKLFSPKEIPDDIRKWIEDEAEKYDLGKSHWLSSKRHYAAGAIALYTFLSEQIEQKDEAIKRLQSANTMLLERHDKVSDELHEFLKVKRSDDAIDLLRSAFQIAARKGERTNWEAFENRCKEILHKNHSGTLTPRTFQHYEDLPPDNL